MLPECEDIGRYLNTLTVFELDNQLERAEEWCDAAAKYWIDKDSSTAIQWCETYSYIIGWYHGVCSMRGKINSL